MGKKAALIIFGVLVIDQIVKIWIKTTFEPKETQTLVSGFLQLYYVENKGMAFGTTFGSGLVAKLCLSIFRLIAIGGIIYYLWKIIREKKMPFGFIFAISLVLAGAAGNVIDSMFYDYAFGVDVNNPWNWAEDSSGNYMFDENGMPLQRPQGFLLGSVVDMFQFTVLWPKWMPLDLGGKEVFGAIWNVADFSISCGVIWILVRYRRFFKKDGDKENDESALEEEANINPTKEFLAEQ